jgi:hypothetical protein
MCQDTFYAKQHGEIASNVQIGGGLYRQAPSIGDLRALIGSLGVNQRKKTSEGGGHRQDH